MARNESSPDGNPRWPIEVPELIANQAVRVVKFIAQALIVAESKGIRTKPLKHFWLEPDDRKLLLAVPGMPQFIKSKLQQETESFALSSVAGMTLAVINEALKQDDPQTKLELTRVASHLEDRLDEAIFGRFRPRTTKTNELGTKADPTQVYQFKVTLLGSKPPIWRRIQLADCTLDELHEHIQTAMGWSNSNLHIFQISGQLYGNPMDLRGKVRRTWCNNSTCTLISNVLPRFSKRLSFTYRYDFFDRWDHEILFEACPKKESDQQYPRCLEGDRACPPENCGGIDEFHDLLKTLADMSYRPGDPKFKGFAAAMDLPIGFNPEEFDAGRTTSEMKQGLPV